MNIQKGEHKAITFDNKEDSVKIIDQTLLPFDFQIISINTVQQTYDAIKNMLVRGAPVIGACAAYGVYWAVKECQGNKDCLFQKLEYLKSSRPTAVNLSFAIDWVIDKLKEDYSAPKTLALAKKYAQKDIDDCKAIGEYGFAIIKDLYEKSQKTINILTHCNAGWLATGEYGTALAPIYQAQKEGVPVHIWVDETRPRNQGARLTAWELQQENVPFTVISDNTGGHLMQKGMVDLVIVGSDRTSVNGDVANKIGTYLKALAAKDNNVPFYVALPTSTIDINIENGLKDIVIEERASEEVACIKGWNKETNREETIQLIPDGANVLNYAFDVTPAQYVTGLITEKGICKTQKESILALFE